MDWVLVAVIAGIVYVVMSFMFACWSEDNNRYPTTAMDVLWGMLWFLTVTKWLVRLPTRGFNENTARVFKDVWNG